MNGVIKGLVLRQIKVGEADAMLHILTAEQGLISAGAKGVFRIKSSKLSACGQFCYSEFTVTGRGANNYISDARLIKNFYGLRTSVEGAALAMYLAEIAEVLNPAAGEDADNQLRLLLNSLYMICEEKCPLPQIKAVYELRTAVSAGYMPDLTMCAECGRYDGANFYFERETGKLYCEACASMANRAPNLDPAALYAFRHIALTEDKKIFSFTLKESSLARLGGVTEGHLLHSLDKPIKTLGFLNSALYGTQARKEPQ